MIQLTSDEIKSHTPFVSVANTCCTGYPHDCLGDNAAYQQDRRAGKRRYRLDRRADSLSQWYHYHSVVVMDPYLFNVTLDT